MSTEFDLRQVIDLVGEIEVHINRARDASTNQVTDKFAWELGCAMGSSSRLHKLIFEIAQREFYDDGD
jgi:hypothetical protein